MFERVLTSVAKTVKGSLELEKSTSKDGTLQRLDPRFVFVALMSLLVTTVLLRNMMSITLVIVASIALARISRISLASYLGRVWLVVPLFTVVVMLPSMTNLFTPGIPLFMPNGILGTGIYFTEAGVYSGIAFTLRVGAAVSMSVLLVSTVEWSKLMKTMYDLRFPKSFIMILDMTYRYIHLLLDVTLSMFTARKSRISGKVSSREKRMIGASAVTTIFSRAYHMSEGVYLSMVSRGYTGRPRMLTDFKARAWDYAFLVSLVAFGIMLMVLDATTAKDALIHVLP